MSAHQVEVEEHLMSWHQLDSSQRGGKTSNLSTVLEQEGQGKSFLLPIHHAESPFPILSGHSTRSLKLSELPNR